MQSKLSAAVFGDKEDPRKRLAALFGGEVPASGQPPESAMKWAADVLRQSDGSTAGDEVTAIRSLRKAEPRLTLKAASFLATHAMREG